MIVVYFVTWTFILYWIHRISHIAAVVREFHYDHHVFIVKNGNPGWQWNNLLLFNDTWKSTIDLWVTEVVPTFIFSWITGQWWIFIFYYLWASFFQENLEHNTKINFYPFTSGRWHLYHHIDHSKNFSLFFPIWDIIFGTNKNVD